jgi:hypothetical protein
LSLPRHGKRLSRDGSFNSICDHRRTYAPEEPYAEESLTARFAAVSGKSQSPLQVEQSSPIHSLAGDVLQVEVPALWAMGKSLESHGHAPGIKAVIARMTAPWPQAGYCKDVIDQTIAVRSKNIGAAALRTDHRAKSLLFSSAEYIKLPPGASCRNSVPRTGACRMALERNLGCPTTQPLTRVPGLTPSFRN